MEIVKAIFIGLLFGFILQKSGAANPQRIIDMLRLKDFHLMKAKFGKECLKVQGMIHTQNYFYITMMKLQILMIRLVVNIQ